MDRYKIIDTISEQEFGIIARAIHIDTGSRVMIKSFRKKFYSWEECVNLREIRALRTLRHPNIIAMKEVIKKNEELFCVYEEYTENLFDYYQAIRETGENLSERQIKSILYQIVSAVQHVHSSKFFHRDLSPDSVCVFSNIIENRQKHLELTEVTVKLTAFQVAREISARNVQYTDYITTRWYRAPEQLVHSLNYNHKVDIWAIGCIMAELFLLGPFFNGVSEQDQLLRIISVLGTPSQTEFPEFYTYIAQMKLQITTANNISLKQYFPQASSEAIDLMKQLFRYNPSKRPTCNDILRHSFFEELGLEPQDYNTPTNIITQFQQQGLDKANELLQQNLDTKTEKGCQSKRKNKSETSTSTQTKKKSIFANGESPTSVQYDEGRDFKQQHQSQQIRNFSDFIKQ